MFVRLPLAFVLAVAAGPAGALDLARVTPGATLADITAMVAADGGTLVRLTETRGGERSTYLLPGERPAQFSFCRGRLSSLSEALPGGLAEFVARAEQVSLSRGLAVPHMSLLPNADEITYSEWPVDGGGRLTLAWTASASGAMGVELREWPCQSAASLPIATLQPAVPVKSAAIAPAAKSGSIQAEATGAEPPKAIPPLAVSAPDIVVALPETTSELAVNRLAALSGATGSPSRATDTTAGLGLVGTVPVSAETAESGAGLPAPHEPAKARVKPVLPPKPAPLPQGRVAAPKAKPPAPAVAGRILPTVTSGTPPRQAGATSRPLVLFPEDPELDQTNTTAPAAAAAGLDAAAEPVPGPTARRQAPERRQVAGRPQTPADCASTYRSYNPRTGMIRTSEGITKPCP